MNKRYALKDMHDVGLALVAGGAVSMMFDKRISGLGKLAFIAVGVLMLYLSHAQIDNIHE